MCKQAQAALMYDAVQVLVDAILRLLRKKPDILRGTMRRSSNMNSSRIIDCNPKGKITPYEHGDKISRMIKKVGISQIFPLAIRNDIVLWNATMIMFIFLILPSIWGDIFLFRQMSIINYIHRFPWIRRLYNMCWTYVYDKFSHMGDSKMIISNCTHLVQ